MSISNIDIKQKKQYVHLKKKKKGVSLTCVMMYFAVTGSISPTLRRPVREERLQCRRLDPCVYWLQAGGEGAGSGALWVWRGV